MRPRRGSFPTRPRSPRGARDRRADGALDGAGAGRLRPDPDDARVRRRRTDRRGGSLAGVRDRLAGGHVGAVQRLHRGRRRRERPRDLGDGRDVRAGGTTELRDRRVGGQRHAGRARGGPGCDRHPSRSADVRGPGATARRGHARDPVGGRQEKRVGATPRSRSCTTLPRGPTAPPSRSSTTRS